jgi:hypothetical protein
MVLNYHSKEGKNKLSISSNPSCTSQNVQLQTILEAMTDIMPNLFINVHPSTAILGLFLDRNSFQIASAVSVYSLRQMLFSVHVDGMTNLPYTALYDHRDSWFDVAFHELSAETNSNLR